MGANDSLTDSSHVSTLVELADLVNAAHRECVEACGSMVGYAVTVGRHLLAAKQRVQQGEWMRWIRDNCEFTHATACRYMKVAEFLGAQDGSELTSTLIRNENGEDSISEALRLIAGSKEGSREAQDDEIVSRLKAGEQQMVIASSLKIAHDRVARLYRERVVPELVATDWENQIKQSPVKEYAAAEHEPTLRAAAKQSGFSGGWQPFAVEKLGCRQAFITAAVAVVANGCSQLKERAKNGHIALTTAHRISKKSEAEQLEMLRDLKRKNVVSPVDALRSAVSAMANSKFAFDQEYGVAMSVFQTIASEADKQDLIAIISNCESLSQWLAQVAKHLGKK